jgi:hypothetical protein
MVALPDMDLDPTLEAMHKAVEARAALEPKRKYLGASVVGQECERNVWYTYNGYPSAPIPAKGLYAIEDGHRTEDLIAERLRLVPGIKLWTVQDNGEQFGFSKFEDKMKGHIDGVIEGLLQSPKTPHIWEHKAVNERKFNELTKLKEKFGEKNALREWDYVYYVQGQIYMGEFDLTRHYLTVSTPGGRDIISCRTEFDRTAYASIMAKAQRIIAAKEPPARISERKEHFKCKGGNGYFKCRNYDNCWGKENDNT